MQGKFERQLRLERQHTADLEAGKAKAEARADAAEARIQVISVLVCAVLFSPYLLPWFLLGQKILSCAGLRPVEWWCKVKTPDAFGT